MTQPKKVILSELLGSDMIEPMPIKEHLYGSDYNF